MNRGDNARLVNELARNIARKLDGYAGLVIVTIAAEGDHGVIACDSSLMPGVAVTEQGRDTMDALGARIVGAIRREVTAEAEAGGGHTVDREDVAAELACGQRGAS